MSGQHEDNDKLPVPWGLLTVLIVFCAACIALGAIYS